MPEGDTIHALARRLRAALVPGTVDRLETRSPGPRARPSAPSLDDVEARGKHLLVAFGDGLTLHVHLGMDGSVRLDDARPRAGGRVRGRRTAGSSPCS